MPEKSHDGGYGNNNSETKETKIPKESKLSFHMMEPSMAEKSKIIFCLAFEIVLSL